FFGDEAGLHGEHGHAVLAMKRLDRKSTRLNSSHSQISYAVFCLKKKKKKKKKSQLTYFIENQLHLHFTINIIQYYITYSHVTHNCTSHVTHILPSTIMRQHCSVS